MSNHGIGKTGATARMSIETKLPEAEKNATAAVSDPSPITDVIQVVSCAVGVDRAERQRQKIRRELVQQYFMDEPRPSDSMLLRLKKIFGRG